MKKITLFILVFVMTSVLLSAPSNLEKDIKSLEEKITGLTDEAEKARDYLMKLPGRMTRIAERMVVSPESHVFKWVQPALIK